MSELMVNETLAQIKVIGVGGAGGNALDDMIKTGITNIEFVATNTDSQDLNKSKANKKLQLGEKLTKGLGAGANPDIGRQAAEEDKEKIRALLEGTDMLFITAGMGGGTGTGASPVIAEIARDMEILTVAVVTKPFSFEGPKRKQNAEEGIKRLKETVDTLVVIPNNKLFELDKKITLKNAFVEANNILKIGIKGVADLITTQGFINLDFADVKTIMKDSGIAMLGFGYAEGEDKADIATQEALASPLLEKEIKGATKILLNITGGSDLGLLEANEIAEVITKAAGNNTTEVIFGTVMDEDMEDSIKITIVATNFKADVSDFDEKLEKNIKTKQNKKESGNKNEEVEVKKDAKSTKPPKENDDYGSLDIPAFIRRRKK
ncbi:MAG: cell division protein FtsZ [Fusobacteriota bacterium]